jgi:RAQPRD family integrative conjugative element protein
MSIIVLIGTCTQVPTGNAASASEQTNVEVMTRQLNALEDTVRRSAEIADEPGKRFFLDYERLAGDIRRMRHGLESYLSPSRAQPRDPVEISGSYTTTGKSHP